MPIRTPDGYLDITNATLRGSEIITTSKVGIANSAPTHTLSVGNKLFVDDSAANVLTVTGNLVATSLKIGQIDLAPSYALEHVANVGNTISNVVQFTNTGTGFVSASNVGIGTTTSPAGLFDVVGAFRMRYQDMGVTKAHIITGANSTSITESGGTYTYTRAGSSTTGNFLPNPSNIVPKVGQRYRVKLTARSDYAGTIRYECPTSTIITTYDLTATFKEYTWDFTATGTTMQFAVTTASGTTSQFNAFSIERLGVGFNVNPTSTTAPVQISGVTHFSDNVGIGTASPLSPLDTMAVKGITTAATVNDLVSNATIRISGYAENHDALCIGMLGTDTSGDSGNNPYAYIQNIWDNPKTARPLLLNPAGGNVGIGTTSPLARLDVQGTGAAPLTSHGTTTAIMRTRATNTNVVLDQGALPSSPWSYWMQVSDSTDLGLEYPLALNPNGGSVGIGTASPTSKLELAANGGSSLITLKRTNASNGGAKGGIRFTENTNGYNVATIACLGDGANTSGALCFYTKASSTETGIYLPTTDERMRITSTGNVGIGTASPTGNLQITSDLANASNQINPAAQLVLHSSLAGLDDDGDIGASLVFTQRWSDPDPHSQGTMGSIHGYKNNSAGSYGGGLIFKTQPGSNTTPVERMRIDKTGNVGFGTASPGEKLHVHENLSTSGHQIAARIGGSASASYNTLVFGSKDGRPHVGGHRSDYGAWADLSFQNDLMVLKQSNMRVGINTSSPAYPLDVSFAGDSGMALRSTSSHTSINFFPSSGYSYLRFNEANGSSSVWIQAIAGGHLAIRPQGGNETFRFTSGGDVNMNYGDMNFGTRTTQHLNLWSSNYGIGVQANTLYFRSYDHFAFHEDGSHSDSALDPGSGGSLRMCIRSGGFVGIGTATPSCWLHVHGSGGSSGQVRYFNYSGGMSGTNQYLGSVTLRTSHGIISGDYVAVASDERIKKNIIDADDAECLDTLRLLKPKKYRYRDEITKGTDPVWGFIAQEVREILPHSTLLQKKTVPNIYELANVSSSNVITFTNFNTADLESNATTVIKSFGPDNKQHDIHLEEVIDAHSIRVKEDLTHLSGSFDAEGNVISEIVTTTVTPEEYEALEDKTGYVANITGYQNANVSISVEEYNALEETSAQNYEQVIQDYTKTITTYPGNQLFVYGQQVDDFVFLKKEAIWTVATAALQEVDRQLQAEKSKTTALETKLQEAEAKTTTLETKLQEAEAKTTALETKRQEAEAKIATLQAEKEAIRSDLSSLVLRVTALES